MKYLLVFFFLFTISCTYREAKNQKVRLCDLLKTDSSLKSAIPISKQIHPDSLVLPDGSYNFDFYHVEHQFEPVDKIMLVIKAKKISIYMKEELMREMFLVKNKKTGRWMLSEESTNLDSDQVGGCATSDLEIDFAARSVTGC
ncbi:hypothetical protein WSM22_45980 [Cytophagales bacterium WSM2-2]|nr:hypothetical protein WSM22_45980 [Cytophagales bacterium WSM2-2]